MERSELFALEGRPLGRSVQSSIWLIGLSATWLALSAAEFVVLHTAGDAERNAGAPTAPADLGGDARRRVIAAARLRTDCRSCEFCPRRSGGVWGATACERGEGKGHLPVPVYQGLP